MPSDDELYLYVTNDGDIYREYIKPAIREMVIAKRRGGYSREGGIELFMPAVTAGANKFQREIERRPFSQAERRSTATAMRNYHETEFMLGNYKDVAPEVQKGSSGKTPQQIAKEVEDELNTRLKDPRVRAELAKIGKPRRNRRRGNMK